MESEYEKGYRKGFLDGFHAARDNDSLMSPNIPLPTSDNTYTGCQVCKLDSTKGTWGYVCPRSDCPTRIT